MNEPDLNTVLRALDIEPLHRNRRKWIVAACPFAEFLHERGTDRNPSFNIRINEDGPTGWKCFTCHQKGGVQKLIARLGHYRDADYRALAAQALVMEVPERLPDFEAGESVEYGEVPEPLNPHIYLAMYPLAGEDADCRAYLQRRGIDRTTAELLQLRYDPECRRVMFPVFSSEHELYGFTGRSIVPDDLRDERVPKIKNYAGLRKDLRVLGEHLIEPGKPLLVVEGLFAFAHAIARGAREFCNPVAIMGSNLSDAQRDLLIAHDLPIFLLLDDNAAGNIGLFGPWDPQAQEHEGGGAVDKLREHVPTFIGFFPDGIEDPDPLTTEQFRAIIEHDHDRA